MSGSRPSISTACPANGRSSPAADASRVLMFFHGGGYCSGSIASHRRMATEAGRAGGLRTLGGRLSPRPRASVSRGPRRRADRLAVPAHARGIAAQANRGRRRQRGRESDARPGSVSSGARARICPGCLWLVSPWTDLTMSGATLASKSAVDPLIHKEYLEELAQRLRARTGWTGGTRASRLSTPISGTAADLDPGRLGRDPARRRRPLRRRGGRGRRLGDARDLAAHDPCLAALERGARTGPPGACASGRVPAREPVGAAHADRACQSRSMRARNAGRTDPGYRADELTTELNVEPDTPSSAEPRSGLIGNPAFMVILVATSLSSVGWRCSTPARPG